MRFHKNISSGCSEWSDQVQNIIELETDNPLRLMWEKYTGACEACLVVLTEETRLKSLFSGLPEPHSSFITSMVMGKIRAKSRQNRIFKISDFGWGLSTAVAGMIAAFVLTNSAPKSVVQSYDPISEYEMVFAELENGSYEWLWESGEVEQGETE